MSYSSHFSPRDVPERSNTRILIVDDETHVLAVGKAMLVAHGFECAPARSGEEALELLRASIEQRQPFTAAILDLTMPGGASGFEVLEAIHACVPDLPVIACSGYFQEDVRDLCQAIGFSEVLHKPFSFETLGQAVRRAMAQPVEVAQPEVLHA